VDESFAIMDDLNYLREHLPAYADYADQAARHLVDKQVRATMGEALSVLRVRLTTLDRVLAERLNERIFACEFGDQEGIRAIDHIAYPTGIPTSIHAADRAIVALAERATTITAAALPGYLDAIDAAFAARRHAIDALTSGT